MGTERLLSGYIKVVLSFHPGFGGADGLVLMGLFVVISLAQPSGEVVEWDSKLTYNLCHGSPPSLCQDPRHHKSQCVDAWQIPTTLSMYGIYIHVLWSICNWMESNTQ